MSNADRMIRGENSCTGLTALGREQAERLARRIETDHRDDPITQLYSTSLARAVETAQPVSRVLGLEIQHMPQWRYTNYGTADGRTWSQVYHEFPGAHPALHPDRPIAEGAEPMTTFRASTREAVAELARRHRGEHVVAFGSTENVMAVVEVLLDLPPDARCRSKLAIDHTGITTWDLMPAPWSPAGQRAVLVRHNDATHLPEDQQHSRFRATVVLGS